MKKIMFNDRYCLTQAVLEGRKTMTRRIVKEIVPAVKELRINGNGLCEMRTTRWATCHVQPKYKIGEDVAVAQSYKDIIGERVWLQSYVTGTSIHCNIAKEYGGWNNKMFVAPEYMPHHIRITDIKVERLQDCSDDDCLKEGIYASNAFEIGYGAEEAYVFSGTKEAFSTPREAFAALIDKVNGKGTWESNPWVFAYSFELLEGGEE